MKHEDFEYLLKSRQQDIGLTDAQVKTLLQEVQAAEEEERALREKEREKQAKKGVPYPVVVATRDIPGLADVPFFVLEAPDTVDHTEVVPRFARAVSLYNQDLLSRRGKKRQKFKRAALSELGEAMEHLPRTWLKGQDLKARFKVPAILVVASNELQLPDAQPEAPAHD